MAAKKYDAQPNLSKSECLALPYAKGLVQSGLSPEIVVQIVRGSHPDLHKLANSKIARKTRTNKVLIKIIHHRDGQANNIAISKDERFALDNIAVINKTRKTLVAKGLKPVEFKDEFNELLKPLEKQKEETDDKKLYHKIIDILPHYQELEMLPDIDKEEILSSLKILLEVKSKRSLKKFEKIVTKVMKEHSHTHKTFEQGYDTTASIEGAIGKISFKRV